MMQPTKVRLRKSIIRGADFRLHTKNITVYETMCKPYITAKIMIVDNNNSINALNLRGGEECSFAFDGGGRVYDLTGYILTISGEQSTQNLTTITYTITIATQEYFNDRANVVQKSFVNIPGTAAIQQIASKFLNTPLKVLMPSLGMIAQQNIGSYISSNVKPFKAIEDIAKRLTYSSYKSGSTIFFRDRDSLVLAPLEHLFAIAAPQESFIQKSTWGADWRDAFNAVNAIIMAKAELSDEKGSGRGGGTQIPEAINQALSVFDRKLNKMVVKKLGSNVPLPSGLGNVLIGELSKFTKGIEGGNAGSIVSMDSSRNPLSVDKAMNTLQEKLFQALVKNGANYYIKVPIQTGINCTVGKGIYARLQAPVGDGRTGLNIVSGIFLVADLMHECYFDDRQVQATTTFRAVKKGYGS